jgi:ABC-2 type transport system permease protein
MDRRRTRIRTESGCVIAIELRKLFRRPRTWLTIALLDALPTIVAILLAITHLGPRPGQGPAFLSAVLTNGSLFAVAALAVVLPLFLPVAVAVIAGDAVAGEAQSGMLRYLLIRPVGRTRLLVAKLVATFAFVAVAVLIVSGTGYVVGRLLLGHGSQASLSAVVTSVSGSPLTPGQIAWRTIITIGYVAFSMVGVAAMALFLSTLTDSPLSATIGALSFLIGSSLLLTLDAARALLPYLPTRYWLSFIDLFRDPILWRNVERGVALQAVYVVVLLGAAWANLATKDITS